MNISIKNEQNDEKVKHIYKKKKFFGRVGEVGPFQTSVPSHVVPALTVFRDHPCHRGLLVRLEVLWLGLLASGHAANDAAGDVSAFGVVALRDVPALCRYISEEASESNTR